MARLQRLHAAAGRLAEDAPEIIAHPEAARGLEQALIEAMVDCLASSEVRENTWPKGNMRSSYAAFAGGESGAPALHPGDLQCDRGL